MRYFSSDSHFGHERLLQLGDGRPFRTVQEMNWTILNNIFATVTAEDEYYHLGDAAMGNFDETIELMALIPGKKYLVPGNHDRVFPKLNSKTYIERFLPRYQAAGFEVLPLQSTITIVVAEEEVEVVLSHLPYSSERYPAKYVDKLSFARPEDRGLPLIHGHTHQKSALSVHPREYCVGVDAHSFKPVPETVLATWLEEVVQKA